MSLTTAHDTIAARRLFPLKAIAGMAVGLAAATVIAVSAVQLSAELEATAVLAPGLSHAEFVEINTTGLPLAEPAVEASAVAVSPVDRFIAVNTVGIPPMDAVSDRSTPRDFLYWNTEALELAGTHETPDGGVSSTSASSGPR